MVEASEVRAFGLLLRDMLDFFRVEALDAAGGSKEERAAAAKADRQYLSAVAAACAEAPVGQRPPLRAVAEALSRLGASGAAAAALVLPL